MRKYYMQFQKWINLQESNLVDLYKSTVEAFPRTRFRQHATNPIKIVELTWTPFKGVKTLFIKGHAESSSGLDYNPMVLFKRVKYHDFQNNDDLVEIIASDGQNYLFERLNNTNEVLVRCNCKDFKYRFAFYNFEDSSLYGNKPKKYEGQGLFHANPLELPGMCKHLIKTIKSLKEANIFVQ